MNLYEINATCVVEAESLEAATEHFAVADGMEFYVASGETVRVIMEDGPPYLSSDEGGDLVDQYERAEQAGMLGAECTD